METNVDDFMGVCQDPGCVRTIVVSKLTSSVLFIPLAFHIRLM